MMHVASVRLFPRLDDDRYATLNRLKDMWQLPREVMDEIGSKAISDHAKDGLITFRRFGNEEAPVIYINLTARGKAALKGRELYDEEVQSQAS